MYVRKATAQDALTISILLDAAFDGPSENILVRELRRAGAMGLELVSSREQGGAIDGYVGFAKLDAPLDWWALSPVAVLPRVQRQGIGAALIRHGLDRARQAGAKAISVLGDPHYYMRFGFSRDAARNLRTPYSKEYVMLYPLAQGTSGASEHLVYPAAFSLI